jgi:hypothetical protein
MRVYVSSTVSNILSAITLVLSFCLFGFVLWQAIDLWQADPALQQIQELVDDEQP